MSTCSCVFGVIDRTWSLSNNKTKQTAKYTVAMNDAEDITGQCQNTKVTHICLSVLLGCHSNYAIKSGFELARVCGVYVT